jgi:hypothetical protein
LLKVKKHKTKTIHGDNQWAKEPLVKERKTVHQLTFDADDAEKTLIISKNLYVQVVALMPVQKLESTVGRELFL